MMDAVETIINSAGWKAVAVFAWTDGQRRLYHHAIYGPEALLDVCRAHGSYDGVAPSQIPWFPLGSRCPACAAADASL